VVFGLGGWWGGCGCVGLGGLGWGLLLGGVGWVFWGGGGFGGGFLCGGGVWGWWGVVLGGGGGVSPSLLACAGSAGGFAKQT